MNLWHGLKVINENVGTGASVGELDFCKYNQIIIIIIIIIIIVKHNTLTFVSQCCMFQSHEQSSSITLQKFKKCKYTFSIHYCFVRSH